MRVVVCGEVPSAPTPATGVSVQAAAPVRRANAAKGIHLRFMRELSEKWGIRTADRLQPCASAAERARRLETLEGCRKQDALHLQR